MEEWGTIITAITTILPFPTNQRWVLGCGGGGCFQGCLGFRFWRERGSRLRRLSARVGEWRGSITLGLDVDVDAPLAGNYAAANRMKSTARHRRNLGLFDLVMGLGVGFIPAISPSLSELCNSIRLL